MDDGKYEIRGSIDMSASGSFSHRTDGAQLMAAFKGLVENPLGLVA